MATLYKTNGAILEVKPQDGKTFSLVELQKIVEGYIEPFEVNNDKLIILNEEGRLKNLPRNEQATKLWNENFPDNPNIIVGDVIVIAKSET